MNGRIPLPITTIIWRPNRSSAWPLTAHITVDVPVVLTVPPGTSALTPSTEPMEDFAENFMHFVKHRGALPSKWQTRHIDKRWDYLLHLTEKCSLFLNHVVLFIHR
jgi:hypothetical protein